MKQYTADIEVYQKATPLLAPMIEAGFQVSEPVLNQTIS
jgi:predicted nucleic acid-binding protein